MYTNQLWSLPNHFHTFRSVEKISWFIAGKLNVIICQVNNYFQTESIYSYTKTNVCQNKKIHVRNIMHINLTRIIVSQTIDNERYEIILLICRKLIVQIKTKLVRCNTRAIEMVSIANGIWRDGMSIGCCSFLVSTEIFV